MDCSVHWSSPQSHLWFYFWLRQDGLFDDHCTLSPRAQLSLLLLPCTEVGDLRPGVGALFGLHMVGEDLGVGRGQCSRWKPGAGGKGVEGRMDPAGVVQRLSAHRGSGKFFLLLFVPSLEVPISSLVKGPGIPSFPTWCCKPYDRGKSDGNQNCLGFKQGKVPMCLVT